MNSDRSSLLSAVNTQSILSPSAEMLLLYLFSFLTLCVVSAAEVSDQQEVSPGQDAPLRCRAPTGASVRLLEWSRTDLKERGYVFFYRNRRSYENYQLPSFRGRVELRDPEMEDGDVSVVLKNISAEDAGGYECRVLTGTASDESPRSESRHLIELTVTNPGGSVQLRLRSNSWTHLGWTSWSRGCCVGSWLASWCFFLLCWSDNF